MEHLNAIALSFVQPQLTPLQLMTLYRAVGSATAIVENKDSLRDILPDINENFCRALTSMDAALHRAEEEVKFCEEHKIQVLTPDDDNYPRRLQECPDAPLTLYYRGSADLNARRIVCIIGTRKCTLYGQDLIRRFVEDLKQSCPDVLVVSGLAYGVDIHAHRNALNNGLDTVGVVAHGMDMIYPTLHRDTARQMVTHGGILTEYPSHTRIDKRNFLQRNRIVAGLSDACILPESAIHGGGLSTCRISNEYGRNVFAFPGPVNAEYSQGCNNLIRRNGATLITSAADFIEDIGWGNDALVAKAQNNGIERELFPSLSPDETAILNALKVNGNLHPDQIAGILQMKVADVNATLFMMELNGIVQSVAGGLYHLIA